MTLPLAGIICKLRKSTWHITADQLVINYIKMPKKFHNICAYFDIKNVESLDR
ncbi:hypothetical protein COPEUT_02106 [Coprococcus eutactus ATCC 27759]|nr:hypothetical protein COPEUT_02106 [Coprococcus eutactus ATCC 27759]